MGFLLNIRTCHRCDRRQRPCAGPCACLPGTKDIIDHATAGDCPLGLFTEGPDEAHVPSVSPPLDPSRPDYTGYDGSALWAKLHTATVPDQAFINQVTAEIPCGHCKRGWLAMLERTPPDFTSLGGWRQWTVDRHNEVNAKLAKPLVTYPDAALRWNW